MNTLHHPSQAAAASPTEPLPRPRVAMLGRQGAVGLALGSRLKSRRDIELVDLPRLEDRRTPILALAALKIDVVILCLPAEPAQEAVKAIEGAGLAIRILDASSAHRLDPSWLYGFPYLEFYTARQMRKANRVANPGCFAMAAIAMLRPISGLLPKVPVAITAVGSLSSGGRRMLDAGDRFGVGYSLRNLDNSHRHVEEIHVHGRLSHAPAFMPAVASHQSGAVVQIPLHLPCLGLTFEELLARMQRTYEGTGIVVVGDNPRKLDATALAGTDGLRIIMVKSTDGTSCLMLGVFDNLGFGSSSLAIQNLEVMLGLERGGPRQQKEST